LRSLHSGHSQPRHRQGHPPGANATLDKLAAAREQRDFSATNQLQKNLAFHVSGHVLHSLFWRNIAAGGARASDYST
jgi:Fe-Mn family superoxide dismutase